MNRERLKQSVWAAVHEEMGELVPNGYDATVALSALGYDSLDEIELMMGLEYRFEVVIEDEEWSGIETVGDIVALFWGKVVKA